VLVRVAQFQAMHLSRLEDQTRAVNWSAWLRPDVPVMVDAVCKGSKIYHQGAAAERVAKAVHDVTGAPLDGDSPVRLMLRIENNQCTLSLDTSGELLHKRGHKEAVSKAPMRETLAALFLRACGYGGQEPVLDPMCGSGTFVIEAAEIAAGLRPGRSRRYAFERLATFDQGTWQKMQTAPTETATTLPAFQGRDRDAGAIRAARANADRAGVKPLCTFTNAPIGDLTRPDGPPGLVICNPPYGARIGDKRQLYGLYAALGKRLMSDFHGWRVGIITTDEGLAKATGLSFYPPSATVAHGGLKVRLWQTKTV
jgi:putative N6-adenine-specific DNA methylase